MSFWEESDSLAGIAHDGYDPLDGFDDDSLMEAYDGAVEWEDGPPLPSERVKRSPLDPYYEVEQAYRRVAKVKASVDMKPPRTYGMAARLSRNRRRKPDAAMREHERRLAHLYRRLQTTHSRTQRRKNKYDPDMYPPKLRRSSSSLPSAAQRRRRPGSARSSRSRLSQMERVYASIGAPASLATSSKLRPRSRGRRPASAPTSRRRPLSAPRSRPPAADSSRSSYSASRSVSRGRRRPASAHPRTRSGSGSRPKSARRRGSSKRPSSAPRRRALHGSRMTHKRSVHGSGDGGRRGSGSGGRGGDEGDDVDLLVLGGSEGSDRRSSPRRRSRSGSRDSRHDSRRGSRRRSEEGKAGGSGDEEMSVEERRQHFRKHLKRGLVKLIVAYRLHKERDLLSLFDRTLQSVPYHDLPIAEAVVAELMEEMEVGDGSGGGDSMDDVDAVEGEEEEEEDVEEEEVEGDVYDEDDDYDM